MFLLAASPTPGTSGAVPGAMTKPSGSGRMSQVCAEVWCGCLVRAFRDLRKQNIDSRIQKYGPRSATAPRTNQYVPRASVYSVSGIYMKHTERMEI